MVEVRNGGGVDYVIPAANARWNRTSLVADQTTPTWCG
jgi:hypothetical protein